MVLAHPRFAPDLFFAKVFFGHAPVSCLTVLIPKKMCNGNMHALPAIHPWVFEETQKGWWVWHLKLKPCSFQVPALPKKSNLLTWLLFGGRETGGFPRVIRSKNARHRIWCSEKDGKKPSTVQAVHFRKETTVTFGVTETYDHRESWTNKDVKRLERNEGKATSSWNFTTASFQREEYLR